MSLECLLEHPAPELACIAIVVDLGVATSGYLAHYSQSVSDDEVQCLSPVWEIKSYEFVLAAGTIALRGMLQRLAVDELTLEDPILCEALAVLRAQLLQELEGRQPPTSLDLYLPKCDQ